MFESGSLSRQNPPRRWFLGILCLITCAFAGTLLATPIITSTPSPTSIEAGKNAVFRVTASGDFLTYQWFQGASGDTSRPVTGAIGPLMVSNVLRSTTSFWVRVNDGRGSIDSQSATATVTLPVPARLMVVGDNQYGQLGDGTTAPRSSPYPIAPDVIDMATGSSHSLFLKADGSLWATGQNDWGQLGDGTKINRTTPVQVATGVVHTIASGGRSLFLKADGTLWGMGSNIYGELGDANPASRSIPFQIATHVTAAAAGDSHTLFIKDDGSLWACGYNSYGQLGDGTTTNRQTPIQVATGVSNVAAAWGHTLFIKSNGSLWAMGFNDYGQFGNGTTTGSTVPVSINGGVVFVHTRGQCSHFIKDDGTLWATGSNGRGELGDGTMDNRSTPYQTATLVDSVSTSGSNTLFVKKNKTLWATGYNSNGESGDGGTYTIITPVQVASSVVRADAGYGYSMFLDLFPVIAEHPSDAKVPGGGTTTLTVSSGSAGPLDYQWYQGNSGDTSQPVAGATAASFTIPPVAPDQVIHYWVRISSPYGTASSRTAVIQAVTLPHVQAVFSERFVPRETSVALTAIATGGALSYQWYEGPAGDTSKPVPGTSLEVITPPLRRNTTFWLRVTNVVGSADGPVISITVISPALKLFATGNNDRGQIGNGKTAAQLTPTILSDNVSAFSAGRSHSLFVKTDESLWATGYNNSGQLGDGTTTDRSPPVRVAENMIATAAGDEHSLLLKNDGTLWAMGRNDAGQLGDGTTTNRTTPVQVAQDVISIAAGSAHSLFIKSDGSLWAMGFNGNNELGDGTTINRSTPIQLAQNVVSVSGGGRHSMFIKSDGSLWAMGYNLYGQLGDGTQTNRPTPVQVATDVSRVAAGSGNTFFLKADGTLWGLGSNTDYQLFSGYSWFYATPIQLAQNVVNISAGYNNFFFVKTDSTLWARGYNSYGGLGDGTRFNRDTSFQVAQNVASIAAGSFHTLFGNAAPYVTEEPSDVQILAGGSGNLHFSVTGIAPLKYQWYVGASGDTSTPVPGATSATYQPSPIIGANPYWARVTTPYGSIDSRTATVHVITQPGIGTPPQPTSVSSGENASLSVTASGEGLFYQWFRGLSGDTSDPVAGATGPLLVTPSLSTGASFWVRVSNIVGTVDSPAAQVSVTPPVPGYLRSVGATNAGQTGTGRMTDIPVPVPIATDVVMAGANSETSLFLKTNGSLWVMRPGVSAPFQLTTNVTWLTSGALTSVFVKSDGTLWVLRPGTSSTPTQISTGASMGWVSSQFFYILKTNGNLVSRSASQAASTETLIATGVVRASALSDHLLFVKNDGTLWGYGSNSYGALGSSSYLYTTVQLTSNVARIATGTNTSYFVKTDGTLWGMGQNDYGQLGKNVNSINAYAPVALDTGVSDVSANATHMMYVKTDGSLCGLGGNFFGQLGDGTFTSSSTPILCGRQVKQVSAGFDTTLFVTTDGTLWGCGTNKKNQLGSPAPIVVPPPSQVTDNVTAISAGGSHSLMIKADGTLWACGANSYGQLGDGTRVNRAVPIPIASNVSKASAGSSHSLFIKNDGTLWAMGNNSYGRLGDGTSINRLAPVLVATDVSFASAGDYHSLFVKNDGSVWAMGYNYYGQLGDGTNTSRSTPVRIAENVVSAEAGSFHSLYLKTDGSLWGMGGNGNGQLGDGTVTQRSTPIQITTGVVRIAAGSTHSQFLKSDGSLWAMGSNSYGQLGDTSQTYRNTPVRIATNVTHVTAGSDFTLFTKSDATLWATGYNNSYQLGDGTSTNRTTPVQTGTAVIGASAGGSHSLWLTTTPGTAVTAIIDHPVSSTVPPGGTVTFTASATGSGALLYQWFRGFSGDTSQPVSGATSPIFTIPPATVSTQYWLRVTGTAGTADSRTIRTTLLNAPDITLQPSLAGRLPGGGVRLTAASSTNAHTYQWYSSTDGNEMIPVPGGTAPTLLTLPVRTTTTFQLRATNPSGTAQSNTLIVSPQPAAGRDVRLAGYSHGTNLAEAAGAVASVSIGENHCLFVKTSGTLWGLGGNAAGQLGTGTTSDEPAPVLISKNVITAATGTNHSLFVKMDGTLWAMGRNNYGQLGNDSPNDISIPVLIASGVSSATAGYQHSLYIKADGTLWAMGYNLYGQLGDGTFVPRNAPVQIASSVIMAAAGYDHSLFLKQDGSLWAMGRNTYGALGLLSSTSVRTPVKIADGVVSIAAGEHCSFFVSADGTLRTMGRNNYGQLGYGVTDNNWTTAAFSGTGGLLPYPKITAVDVTAASAGKSHSLWTKYDNALWGTGSNDGGQLCSGTTNSTKPPAKVRDYVWMSAAGGDNSAILTTRKAQEPPVILTHPVSTTVDSGSAATFSVAATGPHLTYQWYAGPTGNTEHPIAGATGSTYMTAPLTTTAQVWVKVSNDAAYSESRTATAIIESSPNAYQDWATSQGLGGPDNSPGADPDGDSRSNLLEYATGTSPGHGDSAPAISITADSTIQKADFTVSLRRDPSLRYTCRLTSDLNTWRDIPLTFVDGEWTTDNPQLDVSSAEPGVDNMWELTLRHISTPEKLFMKISVEK